MEVKMKVVPTADGSGTVPLRTSKNPVLGVYRHHCGNIASVHQPKGRKSHLRYLLCDECGTDQGCGEVYQEKIRANMFDSIEELTEVETVQQNALYAVNRLNALGLRDDQNIEETAKVLTESLTEKATDEISLETSTDAVVTVSEPVEQQLPVAEPVLTETLTEKPTCKVNEPKPVIDQSPAKTKDLKPVRVGFAAILGGMIGGLLAIVV